MRGRINTPDTLIKFSELDNVLTCPRAEHDRVRQGVEVRGIS